MREKNGVKNQKEIPMLTYHQFEEAVFNWLNSKRLKDPSFTFSLRQKASKGRETDYFIGTSKSGYFGFTFWEIPVYYPGSASDLIDFMFWIADERYFFKLQFVTTKNPVTNQNRLDLEFGKKLKTDLVKNAFNLRIHNEENKMFYFDMLPSDKGYGSIEDLLKVFDEFSQKVVPHIDNSIKQFRNQNTEWKGGKISEEKQKEFFEKMAKRRQKHGVGISEQNQKSKETIEEFESPFDLHPNTILYGPPGTGKTINAMKEAVKIADPSFAFDEDDRLAIKKRYDELHEEGLIEFCTFHQSMSYEDFIEGIKPMPPERDKALQYDIKDGIFLSICKKADSHIARMKKENLGNLSFEDAFERLKDDWDENHEIKFSMRTKGKEFTITSFGNKSIHFKKANGGEGHTLSINTLSDIYYGKREAWPSSVGIYYPGIISQLKSYKPEEKKELKPQNYVLIIDEINRGNIAQIFGELITLIEKDKRVGGNEALNAILTYSRDAFAVPPNLYIIGTMNTADRSVEALDAALRRRFSFVFMPPEPDRIPDDVEGIKLREAFNQMNERITFLVDEDHQIGHSFLMNTKTENDIKRAFKFHIVPLLKEFFFNDYSKILLVLGNGFVESNTQMPKFAVTDEEEIVMEKTTYLINTIDDDFDIKGAMDQMITTLQS